MRWVINYLFIYHLADIFPTSTATLKNVVKKNLFLFIEKKNIYI